jgi:type IV pilus assembly protein PilM
MPTPKAAWGMEIGAHAIKAMRLEREGENVRISDFAVIPHKKVLTTPDLDQEEMVRLSLGQFISQKSLEGEHLVMSVPGHAAFARFAKLPPVEPKKVPDIVKFEAVQQIPFPIDEVEWDYQTFASEDSPELEVGIFAITRDRVQQRLGLYAELGISPEALTLSPVALYNAMAYDLNLSQRKGPVIFLDVGTQATDVVIAEEGRCWIRTFPLGGTHFTEAIANAFKLSYSKAEKLKNEASTSKYAKQIMQAMRPVFSDLLQDLQRSIGYYQSLHREQELTHMVGVGSTFKIPGLRKFIGQQLQINVTRLDEFKRITVTGRQASAFAENTVNMATCYGLALQGVGLAPIAANLVPVRTLREQLWHQKTKWFAAAAAIIVIGAATSLYHPLTDRGKMEAGGLPQGVDRALSAGKALKQQFEAAQASANVGATAENMYRLTDYRTVWPYLVNDVATALQATDPQPALLGDDVKAILEIDPEERRLVMLDDLLGTYRYDPQSKSRHIDVTLEVEFSNEQEIEFLNQTIAKWLREHAEPEGARANVPYRILPDTISCNPTELTRFTVGPEGEVSGERSRGGGSGSGGGGSGIPGRRQPPAPPAGGGRPPAGGGMGASGGSGMGLGGGGGGMPGRRQPPTGPRRPPGSGLGGPGAGAGAGAGPGAGAAPPGATSGSGGLQPPGGLTPPGSKGPGSDITAGQHADFNQLAPLPDKPSIYPPESTLYRVPITFTIEIIQPETGAEAAGGTASLPASADDEEADA